jgi:threonine synthase
MITYRSTRGGIAPVDFGTAIVEGFAADGGLFVPDSIPRVSPGTLKQWSGLGYVDLAFEMLSLFIDRSVLPARELSGLLEDGFADFTHPGIVPVVQPTGDENLFVMELFHGPTLSFKDMAMGFLIGTLDSLLGQRGKHASLLVATTGDTGPAAAHAAAGKENLDCWVLFPNGLISEEQQRQMTTLEAPNVHAVGVDHCRDGGDDLDLVVANLFADAAFRQRVGLSSVNSINWGRVLVQAVHYFHAYFQVADDLDETVAFSVPTGAFGNLFGGYLARAMGLPVSVFIAANNANAAIQRILDQGALVKEDMVQTVSSAIDIVVPYNFWRYLYFSTGRDPDRLCRWMAAFQHKGRAEFDAGTLAAIRDGVTAQVVSDAETLATMAGVYRRCGYLLDPHGAVAVAGARQALPALPGKTKVVCLATAHPAKFPDVVAKALASGGALPDAAGHDSIRQAADRLQRVRLGECAQLETGLRASMEAVAKRRKS